MRPPHRTRIAAVMAIASATALVAGLVAPAASGAEPPAPILTSPVGETRALTLITGDRVEITDTGDGRYAATVTPGPGRERVTFQTLQVDGVLKVLPSDAVPFIASGLVDERLFEVSTLLDDGYADLDALPLIVSWSPGTRAASMEVAGAEQVRALPSIDGAALSADADELGAVWDSLTPGTTIAEAPSKSAEQRMAGGIQRVWLDARASASLDRSVPQIGAPEAWDAGYRGAGVTVAVLDTGVDAEHPDLTGQLDEVVDFTGSESGAADRVGHGTHVAATIAGTGAGAEGTRPGVAPEADLIIGKVLDDTGSGYDSWIIAGMEWAAENADIVNMSLGGGPTDGTDPLSLALDALSAQTDALFVVAAGNDGMDGAVSTPSTADSALSVAAVDRDDALAEFSSRGPRTIDGALKPEISAPGVGIIAARAAGTSMGSPVDALYTAASGTSMATPHVAGAAALLAQQNPDWTGQRLKDALISTANPNPGLGVYAQGGGRVDVARAVAQQVTATGIADFTVVTDDESQAQERTVTFRNEGAEEVTLDLAIEAENLDDNGAGTTAFSAPAQVTVPAQGTADVVVTLDPSGLDRGRWSGALTATGADGILVRTAIGAVRRAPSHTVTIRAIGFDGGATFVPSLSLIGDQPGTEYLGYLEIAEDGTVEVEEGTYIAQAIIEDYTNAQAERTGTIILPDIEVTSDMEVVLDARKVVPVTITTPKPSEQESVISWYTHRTFPNGRDIQHGVMSFSRTMPWVTPTDPVREGGFEFASRWQLVRPSAIVTVPGTQLQPQTALLGDSDVLPKPLRAELVTPGAADLEGVGGRVAIVDAPDQGLEGDQVRAAAEAGAKAVILVRPTANSIFTVFEPGAETTPIPAIVVTAEDGAALIRHAQQPGPQQVTVEASRISPYLYDVIQVSPGEIPDVVHHTVTERNSHRVTTTYVESGGLPFAREQRFGWRPWMEYAWNDQQRTVATGHVREEWVSAGDSLWQHQVLHTWQNWFGRVSGGMTGPVRSYDAGRSAERWFDPVVRPGAVAGAPSTRTGDRLALRVADLLDAEGHVTVGDVVSAARVYRDGELLAELPHAWQGVDVPAGAGTYRVELDVSRDDPEWERAVRSSTAWTFPSARPAEGTTTELPLLQVAYDVPTDDEGHATKRAHRIGLQVTDQGGKVLSGATLTAEVSFDDGATWRALRVEDGKKGFSAQVPAGTAPVTLRVTATDGSASLTQEVVRAYARR
ncbi:S8 family serine peptidase [Microbacterium trichothecenolyticum]|uniref:S8 family peptidase n=1 Tax=Microbacterium trichothecenolyticum TaxID=69370 RepID=UPI001C6F1F24|nr:S8 family serine peptidase [Microbacterium trichothecenolyticum]MBW9119535.1 S8 family serine peptidase [Microbacterium trichothecenolyticum]